MKILAIFAVLLLSVSAQYYPIDYTNYNSANALLNYLLTNTQYYLSAAPNSLFFQFAWYISQAEVQGILQKMDDIYKKYGLNGVFLILDDQAGITNIKQYSEEIIRGLDSRWQLFHTKNVYLVILQYTYVPDAWSTVGWKLNFAISCGDDADYYLPESSRNQIIQTYGPTLKFYTNQHMLELIHDIDYAMEQRKNAQIEVDGSNIGVIIVIVVILLCCGGGGAYYGKRRYDTKSGGDGIHVTSAQF